MTVKLVKPQTNTVKNVGLLAYQVLMELKEAYTQNDDLEVYEPPVSGTSDEVGHWTGMAYRDELGHWKGKDYRIEIKVPKKDLEVTGSDRYMSQNKITLVEDLDIPKTSPFLKIDKLRKKENVKTLKYISEIPETFESQFSERFSARFKDLFEGSIDDIEERDLSLESLLNFLDFFQSETKLNYPSLVTSPTGNIVAEWRVDSDHHFSAEFFPNKNVHFVVFGPNSIIPSRTDRNSGITHYETLMELIKPKNVDSWALNNDD